ncbi:MAG: hypothetical protein HKP56_06165 [Anderseniella sp.]|nr:hypothetical protein [Anderseniella sp.]
MSSLPPSQVNADGAIFPSLLHWRLARRRLLVSPLFTTRDVFAALRDVSTALPILAIGLVASAGVAIALLRFGERVAAEKVGQNYAASLRFKLFRHKTRVSARDLAERRSGALSLRFVGDLAAVRGWVSLDLARMISALIVLPAATGALFMMNPDLGIAAGIPIAIGLIVLVLAGPRLGPAHNLEIAASMDEVWVIEDGELAEAGEPDDGIASRSIQRRDTTPRISAAAPA